MSDAVLPLAGVMTVRPDEALDEVADRLAGRAALVVDGEGSLVGSIQAADVDLNALLKGIEQRYNHAKTLQVQFNETYSVQGRARKSESGSLTLRKPGRMRWDYTAPAGKLFLSDGRDVYLYTPDAHRVEKMKLKESEEA